MRSTKIKKDNRPIGVFDSGVGGLSVLIELEKLLPNENFVFLADQYYVPYGEKTKAQLVKLAYKITDYFIKKHDVKMMVVACNTSTCSSVDEVRKKYTLPIVGTVPAIKPASEQTRTKTIGIIATPSTSQSQVLKDLIHKFSKGLKVINIGCKNLENVVEEGELESEEVKKLLEKYLAGIKKSNADCLVLGCTHYPFLKKAIREFIDRPIKLIDGGKAIARQTGALLKKFSLEAGSKKRSPPAVRQVKSTFYSTGDHVKFARVASKLLGRKVKAEKVKL